MRIPLYRALMVLSAACALCLPFAGGIAGNKGCSRALAVATFSYLAILVSVLSFDYYWSTCLDHGHGG